MRGWLIGCSIFNQTMSSRPRDVISALPKRKGLVKSLWERGYNVRFGVVVDALVAIGLAAIPILKDFDVVQSKRWLLGWGIVFVLREIVTRVRLGTYAEIGSDKVARIHSSLAGTVDTVTMKVINSSDRRLGEEGSKALAIGILHRIKDYVVVASKCSDSVRLRATLAVPMPDKKTATHVQVWCYDEPYDDRRWTELPLTVIDGSVLPGSPAAFASGEIQIVDDLHAEPRFEEAHLRRFRSILSIPVKAGGAKGTVLAVLNVDATEPKLFSEEMVEGAILPLVMPSVNLLALVLLMRREGTKYAFNS